MTKQSLKRILYAEDDGDIREIVVIYLEDICDFEVVVCEDGTGVSDLARSFAPDLILLDVMMPKMDGPAALRALQETNEFEHIPVVFMTAKIMDHELEAFRKLGIAEIISKPFDPMTLADQLEEVWSSHGD